MRSARSTTLHAPQAMVCSVDHLASAAGVGVLRDGGSSVDAAIATSAVLAVTTQHMCGMGGDLWAVVHDRSGTPAALCAAGRAGSGADPEALRAEGHRRLPYRGDVRSATVPGCVDGWLALHERYGVLPLAEVLEPARRYAAEGFPAAPLLALATLLLADVPGAGDYVTGTPLRAGDLVRRPLVGEVLEAIGAGGRDAFYLGRFGEGLVELGGGLFSSGDLELDQAEWVTPISSPAWGHEVWTVPPPSQGYLTLAGATIADGLDLPRDPDDPGWAHLLVEAARLAGHDRDDVLHESADGTALIAPDRLAARRERIDPGRRSAPSAPGRGGGTIHLCVAGPDGLAVSLTQSNAQDWGALLVVPGTGVFLHNRGIGFRLEPGHPAELRPGARPPHTLSPALVTDGDGELALVLGTMGGDSQPQVLLQLLARLLHGGQPPGPAVAAPRWVLGGGGFETWEDGGPDEVQLEATAPQSWEDGLVDRGHHVVRADPGANHGHAHVIQRGPGGVLGGAADPRADTGAAQGY